MSDTGLSAIVLTFNEELHLERCLLSLRNVTRDIVVVDSHSTDATETIARKFGAKFIRNAFVNQAQQFNYALTMLSESSKWVLRIDADEYLTSELAISINDMLSSQTKHVGFTLKRRVVFLGRPIRYGGVFPTEILRIFRYGQGCSEERWMDEHLVVKGSVGKLSGELIDDNLNSLTWWIQKHNLYSNREAVEILIKRHNLFEPRQIAVAGIAGTKRFLKEVVYSRMPSVLKVFLYFIYRYILRLGFLDGRIGFAFHFLQAFWYRYLVEAKVQEVERFAKKFDMPVIQAIYQVLHINLQR